MSLLEFTVHGAALIEHCLIEEGFPGNVKTGTEFDIDHGTATSLLVSKLLFVILTGQYNSICNIFYDCDLSLAKVLLYIYTNLFHVIT